MIVVSVMNGFDTELKRRILGVVPHVVISGARGVEEIVADNAEVRAVAPFMRRQGLLIDGGASQLVVVHGIVPEREGMVSDLPAHTRGRLEELVSAGSMGIVVGRGIGYRAGLAKGDRITLVIPEPSAGGNTITPKIAQVEIAGFFEMGSELDYRLALLHLSDLQAITRAGRPGYRLKLDNIFAAASVTRWLEKRLGSGAEVSDWTREYGNFFETVRMEKIMMFVLLSLVIAIAAFNIISSLSMMVKEKQSDIAVLRTLGMSPGRIMMIFVIQGGLIGALGTLTGATLGIPLAAYIPDIIGFFEQLSGTRMLAGTYFDRVPSDVRVPDVLVILAVSMVITLLATLYPAWRAARLRPAEVLHADV